MREFNSSFSSLCRARDQDALRLWPLDPNSISGEAVFTLRRLTVAGADVEVPNSAAFEAYRVASAYDIGSVVSLDLPAGVESFEVDAWGCIA